MMPKKLIEVALPLEAINDASAREKSIRHGHPSTLHLWWARRPLAAARAVIWSSLVDDPSEHPELFPTEEDQKKERDRLFKILSDLVVWENSNDENVLGKAKEEILKYTNGNPPALLDPFAGGGAIPLEAQRLGLEAHAHDLNPVAVIINKAMIEIPPRFAGMPPVNPEDSGIPTSGWKGAAGLAKDVEYYGNWMKEEAYKRIGNLYPKVKVPKEQGGGEATVIAWIWARTVKCPNPACGCEMPLVRSFTMSKKKGNEAWIDPVIKDGDLSFEVRHGGKPRMEGTVNRTGATCPFCNAVVPLDYIRGEGREGRMSSSLMACVAEGKRSKIYVSPDDKQLEVLKNVERVDCDLGEVGYYPGYLNPPAYGLKRFDQFFTDRQLLALATLSDLVREIGGKVTNDASSVGMKDDGKRLADGGNGATAYGDAVSVYLSFVVDKMTDINSSISTWINTLGAIRDTFGMTGISMSWDFSEANPFSNSCGSLGNALNWVYRCIYNFINKKLGYVEQYDAQSDCGLRNVMISTDPPYYNNVPYADFSDFFYGWMRRSLKDVYPDLFRTIQTPKTAELVADPYRNGGKEKAKEFFEDGMLSACRQLYKYANDDIPVTIYYAYKQSDTDEGEGVSSGGWETMLSAVINAGFAITGTWPMRTEMANRSVASGTNALASSIVLVCRKRGEDAKTCTRRDFVTALKREIGPALKKLQQSNIAPVDLAQSAIGPGIAVFSRYKQVLDADGTPMSVKSALQIINRELDLYLSGSDSALDAESRLCVEIFSQCAYNPMKYGDADVLARAKGTSVEKLADKNIVYAAKGEVRLLERGELPETSKTVGHNIWFCTQYLTHAMECGGIAECAEALSRMDGRDAEEAKDLAYRLYSVCERKGWAKEGSAYNNLVVAWPEIQIRAAESKAKPSQVTLGDL